MCGPSSPALLWSLHRDFAKGRKKAHPPRREAPVDKGSCEGDDEEESEDDWEEVEGKTSELCDPLFHLSLLGFRSLSCNPVVSL